MKGLLLSPVLLSLSCMSTDALIVGVRDSADGDADADADSDTDTDADTDSDSDTDPLAGSTRVLLATESAYGSNPDPETWGGILRFAFEESGALSNPAPGIDAQHLHDPWGLAWRETSNEIFVGNRHGNFGAADAAGTIQRFVYDAEAHTFTMNGEITDEDLAEVHQISFDPSTGELYAANGERGISRFAFDGSGVATPNGSIPSGTTRGVVASPGGRKVWATSGTEFVRQFDVGTWSELTAVGTEKGAVLQNLTVHGGRLYAAALSTNAIYRFNIDAVEDLTLVDLIEATSPVGVTFSLDGQRMYVSSSGGGIERFAYDEDNDSWTFIEAVDSDLSVGSMVVLE